ncbi:hypothetical protein [Actinomycetospora cinnamomea]|uniref:hypothetical protein n=1 Tax=Actinomycetospora cinnamomea TaxID=663609 RepID=UPI001402BFE4|nr:hypothetical protein [Actinomycetospora cinnamomea]
MGAGDTITAAHPWCASTAPGAAPGGMTPTRAPGRRGGPVLLLVLCAAPGA